MPGRRNRKGKFGRKRRRAPRNVIAKPPKQVSSTGLPITKIVKMRYVQSYTLDPGIGTVAHQIFRANSIYDPDGTGSGHQPLGADQWATLYGKYQVIASKITLRLASQGAAAYSGTGVVTLRLSTDSVPSGSFDSVDLEQRNCKWRVYNSGYAGNNWSMTKGFGMRRFFQLTTYDDDTTMRNFGANPAEEAFFIVSARGVDAASNPDAVDFVAQVDYVVMLRDPLDLGAS